MMQCLLPAMANQYRKHSPTRHPSYRGEWDTLLPFRILVELFLIYRATRGRQINRIAELKIFGFETVIDLGTPEKTARLHQLETEALGMRYISIPIDGLVPSQEQVDDFTQKVIDASKDMLLVYAPSSALLGTMWAAYRINLGAPVEFAINQGKKMGMGPNQGSYPSQPVKK